MAAGWEAHILSSVFFVYFMSISVFDQTKVTVDPIWYVLLYIVSVVGYDQIIACGYTFGNGGGCMMENEKLDRIFGGHS